MAEEIKKEEIKEAENKSEGLDMEKSAEGGSLPDRQAGASGEKKRVKKIKKQVFKGRATIKCSYNNTMVSISDMNGNLLAWSTSGLLGFKGAKKATPYAATQVVATVAEKVKKYGTKELEVYVRGVGSGRESSIRSLANNGFDLISIKDVTPIPHNGCRPKKPRRV
jgi:small subunit ribosomal protein S11